MRSTILYGEAWCGMWAAPIFPPGAPRWRLGFRQVMDTPWIARRAMASTPVHASHLPERFGLFTIIVLGESLVAVMLGIGATDWWPASAVAAVLGFIVAASLWWLYFDFIDLCNLRRGLLARNVFLYGHLFIALGLASAGVGIKKAILYAGAAGLPVGASWALGGGVALFLVALGLIHVVSAIGTCDNVLTARLIAAAVALSLAAGGRSLRPLVLMALLVGTLTLLAAFPLRA